MAAVLKVLPGVGLALYGFVVWPTISNIERSDVVKVLDWIDAIVWLAGNQTMPKTMRNVGIPRPRQSIQRGSSSLTTSMQCHRRTLHDRFLNTLFEAKLLDRSFGPYLGVSSTAKLQSVSRVVRIPGATLHDRFMRVLRSIHWRRRLEAIVRALSADSWLPDAYPSGIGILLVPILVNVFLRRLLRRLSTRNPGAVSVGCHGDHFDSQTAVPWKFSNAGLTSTHGEGAQGTATKGHSKITATGEVTKPSQRTYLQLHSPGGATSRAIVEAQPLYLRDRKDSDDGTSVRTFTEWPELVAAKQGPRCRYSPISERHGLPEEKVYALGDVQECDRGGSRRSRKAPTVSSAAVLLSSALSKASQPPMPIVARGRHVLLPSGDRQ